MDPTFCYRQEGEISALDLAAFDALGWNTNIDVLKNPAYLKNTRFVLWQYTGGAIPEPATWGLMIAGFGLMGGALRRRARSIKLSYA